MLSYWSRTAAVALMAAILLSGVLSLTPNSALAAAACEPGDSNGDGVVDAGDVSCTILLVFGDHCATECVGASALANVPTTGQTVCYQSVSPWAECTCGTPDCPPGQDGDLERGVPWPDPRFTDNGDGTVTDNLTGLIWLKYANCFGVRAWATALGEANGLESGSCGLTDGSSAGDWRLPNVRELQSLIDYARYDPALPTGHPFTAVQFNSYYSTSMTLASDPQRMYGVYVNGGYVGALSKGSYLFVWPVRGGQ